MPSITCSFVSVCRKGDLLAEVANLTAIHGVLMTGPLEQCVKLCESMEAAAANSGSRREVKNFRVMHTESFAALTNNSERDTELGHFACVVVVVPEGEKAMAHAETEIMAMDPRYLLKPSVDIVNWRTDGPTSQGLTTRIVDILKLSSRLNVPVHSVFGNNEESIQNLGLKMCNHLRHIVAHPHVPA